MPLPFYSVCCHAGTHATSGTPPKLLAAVAIVSEYSDSWLRDELRAAWYDGGDPASLERRHSVRVVFVLGVNPTSVSNGSGRTPDSDTVAAEVTKHKDVLRVKVRHTSGSEDKAELVHDLWRTFAATHDALFYVKAQVPYTLPPLPPFFWVVLPDVTPQELTPTLRLGHRPSRRCLGVAGLPSHARDMHNISCCCIVSGCDIEQVKPILHLPLLLAVLHQGATPSRTASKQAPSPLSPPKKWVNFRYFAGQCAAQPRRPRARACTLPRAEV